MSDHWHQKVASWAPECKKYCVLYYFCMHKGGGWTDLGAHGGAASQSDLDRTSDFARKMSVCCVLATDWGEKLG